MLKKSTFLDMSKKLQILQLKSPRSKVKKIRMLKEDKIWNLPKNDHFWAAQQPTISEPKIKFDPSLEMSWC